MPAALVGFVFGPAFAATVGGQLLAGAIGIGLSVGLQLLTQPKAPKPEDVQNVIRGSIGMRSRLYGRGRLGGHVVFMETKGGTLYLLMVHCQGPVTGFQQTYIDNRLVQLEHGASGGIITDPYKPNLQYIDSQVGFPGVSGWLRLNLDFPEIWGPNHRLEGLCATLLFAGAVAQDKVSKVYPRGIPTINRVIDGAICYDPRNNTANWTANFALQLRDFLTHPDGMKIPAALIDDASFSVAADVCDEPVPIKGGGTIPRYHGMLAYNFDEEPKAVLSRFITATDGRLYTSSEGKIGFNAGKWVEPTVTISDLEGHVIDCQMEDGAGPFREANEIIVRYTHVDVGYKEGTCDPWRDEDSISRLGEVRSNVVTAYEIQHHNHARRIAKVFQKRSSPRWQGQVVCTLHALNAWDKRWINFIYPDLDIAETFEILGEPVLNTDNMTVTLRLQSFGPSAYAFDPELEEGTAPAVPTNTEDEDLPEPTGVTTGYALRTMTRVEFEDSSSITTVSGGKDDIATSTESVVVNQQSQTVQFYVATVQWAAPPHEGLQGEAQYAVNGGPWLGHTVADGSVNAETGPMNRGVVISQRVRFKSLGGASEWVSGADITIPL